MVIKHNNIFLENDKEYYEFLSVLKKNEELKLREKKVLQMEKDILMDYLFLKEISYLNKKINLNITELGINDFIVKTITMSNEMFIKRNLLDKDDKHVIDFFYNLFKNSEIFFDKNIPFLYQEILRDTASNMEIPEEVFYLGGAFLIEDIEMTDNIVDALLKFNDYFQKEMEENLIYPIFNK